MDHFGNVPKTSTLIVTKNTSSQADTGTAQTQGEKYVPPTTFVQLFSEDYLKKQDILTQEQIKSLDVQFPAAFPAITSIGLGILTGVAVGVDFGAAVQYTKTNQEMEKVLSKEQVERAEEILDGLIKSEAYSEELPDELLEGGAFSITTKAKEKAKEEAATKEKEKKAKLKKTILIGVGATALIGGLIFLARKK